MEIPGYKIEKEIGQGGMARVYLGYQSSVNRAVAIKVMTPSLATDSTFSERFVKEAMNCAALNHPNIITVYDAGCVENQHYIIMEYVEGGDLAHRLDQGALELDKALSIVRQIAEALGYSYARGFVHRDVKPENILFREDDTPVLVDFGIAKAATNQTMMTQAGMVIGSPHYMSPEQTRGLEVDGRSDLYSLGVVLYEMLCGKKPYDATDPFAIAVMHTSDPIPQLPAQYRQLQGVLEKLLAKNPEDRYADAQELIMALDKIPDEPVDEFATRIMPAENIAQPMPSPAPLKANAEKKGMPGLTIGIAILVIIVILGGIGVFMMPEKKKGDTPDPTVSDLADAQRLKDQETKKGEDNTTAFLTDLSEKASRLRQRFAEDDIARQELILIYREMLRIEADNLEARKGLADIADLYLVRARNAYEMEDYQKALVDIQLGLAIDQQSEELMTLRSKVNTALTRQQQWQQEQIRQEQKLKDEAEAKVREEQQRIEKERKQAEQVRLEEVRRERAARLAREEAQKSSLLDQLKLALEQQQFDQAQTLVDKLEKIPGAEKELMPLKKKLSDQKKIHQRFASVTFTDPLSDGGAGPVMLKIPVGRFEMGDLNGSDIEGDEKPVHWVSLAKRFAVSQTEITFDQYDRFAKNTNRTLPSDNGWGRGSRPAINVTWEDAKAYTKWLSEQTGKNYRLLSEAEWEYSARAGTQSRYPWGNQPGRGNANCYGCGSKWDNKKTAPVASFAPNEYGLFDMNGNVWEWVEDCWHDRYSGAPEDGSAWVNSGECGGRVLRGGGWNNYPPFIRSANRDWFHSNQSQNSFGFRVARDL